MSTFSVTYGAPNAAGQVVVTVTRLSGRSGETITISPQSTSTATLNTDYTLSATKLTWATSSTNPISKTFVIDMAADGITEPSELINFRFTSTKSTTTAFTSSFTITDAIECFMPGTMILTPSGEVAVETLKIGDLVLTHDGRSEPVRWMGRHTVSTVFADKLKTLPVRIKAGALDENVPSRDLLVSPGHAILVDGALVQAAALINGSSIVQEADVPQVFTYHHVELADHSLIVAENTPAETFVDNVERARFDNAAEYAELYPDAAPIAEMDLPLAMSQRQVASATRRRLGQRGVALYGKALAIAG